MKILFFIESLRSGGKERRLVELIKGLSKYNDIEMELVLTKNIIHYTDIFQTGIKIHYAIRKGIKKDPRIFYKFFLIAKKFRPDVIHVWGNMVAIYAIPAKIILNVPMINNQITLAPLKIQKGLLNHKLTFTFSDLILANSFAGLESYNAPKKKSRVIYNGFDFNRINNLIDKNEIRKKFNINTKYAVGMVASFSDFKDYSTFVNVAILVLNERSDVTFICIGSGDDSFYKKLVTPDNKKNILFLGRQQIVESIMNICDIGVLTTNINNHGEGISNALLEFSSLSKPILATDNGGTPEIITDNKNGFLLKPFDLYDLKNKIELLLNNNNDRVIIGKNAKVIVKNKFGIDKMIEEFHNTYIKIRKK